MDQMIVFHKLKMEDKGWMDERFRQDNRNNCEYSFANNYMWRNIYDVEVADVDGCAIARFNSGSEKVFSYPIGGGDKRAAIKKLLAMCKAESRALEMGPMTKQDGEHLRNWFPEEFLIWGDRKDFDYIYSREKLTTLEGKKMHGKRNHIARFKDGGDWSYESMTIENIPECIEMSKKWSLMREEKWNEEMEKELSVVREGFEKWQELGLVGGVLRKQGEIVAFTVGEPLNEDTFVVHFEKAFPEVQGAYPMINQQFVEHECQNYQYINREEDTGDLGLRRAKLSYDPDLLLEKYRARSSEVIFADKNRDGESINTLWETCFGDEKEFVDFYMAERMTDETMLVIHREGKVVSMASFLEAEYVTAEGVIPARYVYAVATLPAYRGQGLAEEILETAKNIWRGAFVLSPAGKGLYTYYGKLGFRRGWKEEIKIEGKAAGRSISYNIEKITPEEYKKIRDAKYKAEGYLMWNLEAIRFAMKMTEFSGGKTVAVSPKGNEGSAAFKKAVLMYHVEETEEKKRLVVIETTLEDEVLAGILPGFLEETGAEEAFYGLPGGMLYQEDYVTAQEEESEKRRGYLNLILA